MVNDAYVPIWEEKGHSASTSGKWTTSVSVNIAITTLIESSLAKSEIHTQKEYNGGRLNFGNASVEKLKRLKGATIYIYSEKMRRCNYGWSVFCENPTRSTQWMKYAILYKCDKY